MSDRESTRPHASRESRLRARRVLATALRASLSTVALVTIYYLLPLERYSAAFGVITLLIGLLGLVALIAFQIHAIIKAEYPVLRAVGALATSAPLFLLQFAASYFVMGRISAANFSEPLTRTDALYFTVTVFATVGFGDITATTQGARILVTGQMLLGILIVGLGARIFVDAVKHGREQQPLPTDSRTEEGNDPSA
ncbi:MAG: potassium channel family protein [Propionibacteriaceae bacterium]